jgi:hypothetical protein
MAYATASDVAVRWARTPSAEETALIEVKLSDIERMIRIRIPNLEDLVASGDLDVDSVIQVESEAVLRVIRNPEGFVSETDGNYTYQYSQNTGIGKLQILPEEWELLGYSRGGFFELIPTFPEGA